MNKIECGGRKWHLLKENGLMSIKCKCQDGHQREYLRQLVARKMGLMLIIVRDTKSIQANRHRIDNIRFHAIYVHALD